MPPKGAHYNKINTACIPASAWDPGKGISSSRGVLLRRWSCLGVIKNPYFPFYVPHRSHTRRLSQSCLDNAPIFSHERLDKDSQITCHSYTYQDVRKGRKPRICSTECVYSGTELRMYHTTSTFSVMFRTVQREGLLCAIVLPATYDITSCFQFTIVLI